MTFIFADPQEITSFAMSILAKDSGCDEQLRATTKTELIRQLTGHPEAVVLIDFTQFDIADADQLLIIVQRFPRSHWLLFSDDLTELFLRTVVFQSHHISIIFKDASLGEIREALHYAFSHRRFLCQRVSDILLSASPQDDTTTQLLTATEIEIIRAIALGKTTREIADERFSSVHTITTHRKNIFRKLNANTAIEAVRKARRAGLIDVEDYSV